MWQHLRQRWQQRREAAAVARKPIADDLWKRTLVRYPFLRRRSAADAAELRRMTSLFLDRKEFDARPGVRLTNDVVVTVAAQACLPVLKLGLDAYDGFVGIVLMPASVMKRRSVLDDDGVVHEFDDEMVGEAAPGGPVLLSWRDVRSAGRTTSDSFNVVVHEFAHVLVNARGLPATPVLQHDYEAFCARVDADEPTALDPYGTESLEEFFGVASEAFFVNPRAMKAEHPVLYGVFVRYYRQDPAEEMA